MAKKLEGIILTGIGEIDFNENGQRYVKLSPGSIQLPVLDERLRKEAYLLGQKVRYSITISTA